MQADETTLKVIGEAKTTCYMWLHCCGTYSPQDYPASWGKKTAEKKEGYDAFG
jgi:hypothetical protein